MTNPQFLMLKSAILKLFKRDLLSNSKRFQIQAFEVFCALPAWLERSETQKTRKKAFLELLDVAKPLQKVAGLAQFGDIFSQFVRI